MFRPKSHKFLLLPSLLITICILFLSCEQIIILTPPENLTISVYTDSVSVKLSWDSALNADGYYVYFNDAWIATVATAEYVHNKPMQTGTYYVTAYRGGEETNPSNTVTDAPVVTETTLYEIEGPGNSGFSWDRNTGYDTTYSMGDSTHASDVDFYFTNWNDDPVGGPWSGTYHIMTPDEVVNDPCCATWPIANGWRQTIFTDALTKTFANVDTLPPIGYYTSQEITEGETYGVLTWDGYFGMVEIKGISTDSAAVAVKTAIQLVQGLRLIKIGSPAFASKF